MSTSPIHEKHVPKPPKHPAVQSWENEGGAVPEQVIFKKQPSFWKRLPGRIRETRRAIARVVIRNPELVLGAAVGVGYIAGARMRRPNYLYALAPERQSPAAALVAAGLKDTVRELIDTGAWTGVEPIEAIRA